MADKSVLEADAERRGDSSSPTRTDEKNNY